MHLERPQRIACHWLYGKYHAELQDDHGSVLHHGNMERAVKVLERMENQNTFKELAMDFKVSVTPAVLHSKMLIQSVVSIVPCG